MRQTYDAKAVRILTQMRVSSSFPESLQHSFHLTSPWTGLGWAGLVRVRYLLPIHFWNFCELISELLISRLFALPAVELVSSCESRSPTPPS
jgi:hypothetical protein